MRTVPTHQLSQQRSTWSVRKSGFPFGAPGPVITAVEADDHESAMQLAEYILGYPVVVELQHAADDSPAFSPDSSREGRR